MNIACVNVWVNDNNIREVKHTIKDYIKKQCLKNFIRYLVIKSLFLIQEIACPLF